MLTHNECLVEHKPSTKSVNAKITDLAPTIHSESGINNLAIILFYFIYLFILLWQGNKTRIRKLTSDYLPNQNPLWEVQRQVKGQSLVKKDYIAKTKCYTAQ
jgi:hypothetical protein